MPQRRRRVFSISRFAPFAGIRRIPEKQKRRMNQAAALKMD